MKLSNTGSGQCLDARSPPGAIGILVLLGGELAALFQPPISGCIVPVSFSVMASLMCAWVPFICGNYRICHSAYRQSAMPLQT